MSNLNLKNRAIFCRDNLDILEGINSNCIDLIYLDPPFNKKKEFTAPMGSSAEGASFRDWFKEEDVKDEWLQTIKEDYDGIYQFLTSVRNLSSFQSHKNKHYLYNYCYLCYMAVRLIEMHRILKDTGSIYLHCDPTMSHYLKILMDLIFGEKSFRNEIVWCYHGKFLSGNHNFCKNHDYLLQYSKTNNYCFNSLKEDIDERRKKTLDRGYTTHLLKDKKGIIKERRLIVYKGAENKENIQKLISKHSKVIYQEFKGNPLTNTWNINIVHPKAKERVGYPTQKPIKLLERIIKASSNEEDVVLDPFCGCATTCVAAEKLDRQWIGIDVSHKAYELVRQRLKNEVQKDLFDPDKETKYTTVPPKRTDIGVDYREKKYVYIISHPNFPGEYKVGIAKDWKSRLNSYQTSDPDREYRLEFKILKANFRETERYIHKKYKNKREWVEGKLEDIIKDAKDYRN